MDFLVSLVHLDPQVMLVMEQLERKVSQDSQDPRVFLVVLGSLALVMLEHRASVELMEILVYLDYQGHQVCQDQEAKCCLVPFLVRMEILVSLVYPDDQVLKVSQVCQEALDVQGLMVPREKEEILVLVANLDLKVFQDLEVTPEFLVLRDGLLTAVGERMEFQGFQEVRVSLERC